MTEAPTVAPPPRRGPWLYLWLLGVLALPAIWNWVDPHTLQIHDALQQSAPFKAAQPFIKPLGKTDVQLLGLLVAFGIGLVLHRPAVKRWLLLSLVCMAATAIPVHLTKFTVRRERPKYEYRLVSMDGPDARPSGNRYRSFPSADTASVFALAFAAGAFVPAAAVPIAVVGCLVGLSRIAVGMHHPADVWGAMLMATGISSLVVRWWRRRFGPLTSSPPAETAVTPGDPAADGAEGT